MKKNLPYKAAPIEVNFHVGGHDNIFDVLKISDVYIEWIDGKPYFKMTLKFPNGSFRQLFIHETALLSPNGATEVKRVDKGGYTE